MSENHDAVVHDADAGSESRCPVAHGRAPHPTQGGDNRGWWPNQLNLKILRKNPAVANPMGSDFDYAAAFNSVDLDGTSTGSSRLEVVLRDDRHGCRRGEEFDQRRRCLQFLCAAMNAA